MGIAMNKLESALPGEGGCLHIDMTNPGPAALRIRLSKDLFSCKTLNPFPIDAIWQVSFHISSGSREVKKKMCRA